MQNSLICGTRYVLGCFFLLETRCYPACLIHFRSMKLQTLAVSLGSLVCERDLFFCRKKTFFLKVFLPVCTAKSLNRVNLQQTRPFYKAYEYQGPRFLLL